MVEKFIVEGLREDELIWVISTPQLINISTYKPINPSTHKHLNLSTNKLLNHIHHHPPLDNAGH